MRTNFWIERNATSPHGSSEPCQFSNNRQGVSSSLNVQCCVVSEVVKAGTRPHLWVSEWMHLRCKLLPSSTTTDKRVHLQINTQIILVGSLPTSVLSWTKRITSLFFAYTQSHLCVVKCLNSVSWYTTPCLPAFASGCFLTFLPAPGHVHSSIELHHTVCRSSDTPGCFMPPCSCVCCPHWLELPHPVFSGELRILLKLNSSRNLVVKSLGRGNYFLPCSHAAVFKVYIFMA